jgi:SAM-dependent methyltransferase
VLNHADDKAAVWREIARVLKPGGKFVISDIYAIEPVPEAYKNDPDAVAECWAGAILKAEYLAAIGDAGRDMGRFLMRYLERRRHNHEVTNSQGTLYCLCNRSDGNQAVDFVSQWRTGPVLREDQ